MDRRTTCDCVVLVLVIVFAVWTLAGCDVKKVDSENTLVGSGRGSVRRVGPDEYGIVCYTAGQAVSCVPLSR